MRGGGEEAPDSGESQTLMIGEEQSLSRSSIFTGSTLKALSCCLSRDSIPPSRATVASRLEDVTSSRGGLIALKSRQRTTPAILIGGGSGGVWPMGGVSGY